jgi:hypothetical protein
VFWFKLPPSLAHARMLSYSGYQSFLIDFAVSHKRKARALRNHGALSNCLFNNNLALPLGRSLTA